MADSKKYDGSTWEHSLRKLGTSTDTITTLPADIYADGNNATVGLVGNMSQTGTPTPQNPITPSETGERTGNLVEGYISGCNINASGSLISNAEFNMFIAKVEQGKTYCLDTTTTVAGYFTTMPTVGSVSYDAQRLLLSLSPFTAPIDGYLAYRKASSEKKAMMNEGNELLPYEPYGYKIPISSASTTTPVYLGEVESTRQIKQLVLTGGENWNLRTGEPSNIFFCSKSDLGIAAIEGYGICSHYRYTTGGSFSNLSDGEFIISPNNIGFRDTGISSAGAWIWYLQQQYANGTPVCVWYVLDTSETAVVNEPIRKIGDYADTVSGITIPTITGKDTFDVLTTLKPSEVSLAYTGWHDATVKELDGSEWQ